MTGSSDREMQPRLAGNASDEGKPHIHAGRATVEIGHGEKELRGGETFEDRRAWANLRESDDMQAFIFEHTCGDGLLYVLYRNIYRLSHS